MKKLIFLIFSMLLISSGEASAQNKVVVIPLGSASAPTNNLYGGGTIIYDGTVLTSFGKPFTVDHQGFGGYNLHLAHLRPGCSDAWPMVLVSCLGAGSCFPLGMVTFCDSGDTDVFISTSNLSGDTADMSFTHLVMLPDTDATLTPALASMAAKSPKKCELNTATGVETCR
ncbi:MAG: hypothetical protein ACYC9M_09920 [Desulfobulbaceae bacterium]